MFVNVAIHPAVPPGGALLRTSVMATHDRPTLDRALDAFADVKAAFEAEHGPLAVADSLVQIFTSAQRKKNIALSGGLRTAVH